MKATYLICETCHGRRRFHAFGIQTGTFSEEICPKCKTKREKSNKKVMPNPNDNIESRIKEKLKEIEPKVFCKCGQLKQGWYEGDLRCPTYNDDLHGDFELKWEDWYHAHEEGNEYGSIADLALYKYLNELISNPKSND